MTAVAGDVWGEGMAASGSTLHLVYGTSDIRYRRSTDQGTTWTAEEPLGSGVLHLTDPIVADGDDVWIVYLDNIQNVSDWCCSRDMGEIWMLHSGNAGETWDAPVQLTTMNTTFRLSIAYAADRLHLVWMDFRDAAWDTYYLRSPNRGTTWDAEVPIAESTGPFGAERPQVAARGDSVHVTIWDDRGNNAACTPGTFTFPKCPDVFHVRSTDGGENWGSIVNVANGGTGFAGRNDIAVSGTSDVVINYNVDLAGETGSKLFAVASNDDGVTWNEPVRLTASPNASDHGSILGTRDATYLVWHDDRDPTNREIFYRRTGTGGLSWDDEEQVSTGIAGDSTTPLNAVTPDYVHVIWIDNRAGTYQVYYRRRTLPSAPTLDGGVKQDAAIDVADAEVQDSGSASRPDASTVTPDASSPRDAATNGMGSDANANVGEDAADDTPSTASSSGCGCRVSRGTKRAPWLTTLVVSALLLQLRRRRSAES
jgi:hypothetical protein